MKKIIQFQVPKLFRIFNLLPLFFLIFLSSCGGSSEHDLFAFKNSDGDWGYLNSEGDIIINNQFEEAYVFNDGLARVVIENSEGNDVYTYVNEKGEYDYNKTWDVAMDFSDGLAIVRNNLGYPKAINTDLEVVLEFPDAYSISRFSDGKAFKFIDYDDTTEATIIDKNGVSVDQAIVGYDGVKIKRWPLSFVQRELERAYLLHREESSHSSGALSHAGLLANSLLRLFESTRTLKSVSQPLFFKDR